MAWEISITTEGWQQIRDKLDDWDRAFELIEQNNTCDNGGFGYWIDREGYHKVWLD